MKLLVACGAVALLIWQSQPQPAPAGASAHAQAHHQARAHHAPANKD